MYPVSALQRAVLAALILTCGLSVNAQDHHTTDRFATNGAVTTTSPFNPPKENDYTFVINSGAGLDTSCTYRNGGPLRITLPIGRVLGNLAMLRANGLVPATVRVEFPAFDVDSSGGPPPERDRVSVNGNVVPGEFMTGLNDRWVMQRFNIPIEWLNFPAEPAAGGTVTPANNEVRIDIDTASGADLNWCTAVDWVTVSIVNPIPPRPWIGAHGILSNSNDWNILWVPRIRALGIPAHQGPDLGLLDSIQSNSVKIANAVSAARARWGVDRVNIVAHSKGGLDSRHFVEGNDSVEKLVQLGTPNAGSPLADYYQGLLIIGSIFGRTTAPIRINALAAPASYQLTRPYMLTYNLFHGSNPKVSYMAVAGVHTPGSLFSDFGGRFLHTIVGEGDLIVPRSSVHALPYTSKPSVFSSFPPTFGPASHTGLRVNQDAFAIAQSLVRAPGRSSNALPPGGGETETSGLMLSGANAAVVDPTLQHTQTAVGTLQQGQTATHVIAADSATTLAFTLFHLEGELDLKLTDPNGQVFDPATVAGNADVSRQESEIPGGLIESYAFKGSFAKGNWTATVTAGNTSGPVDYTLNAWHEDAPLQLTAQADKLSAPAGGDFVFSATLANGTAPVTGATVTASVLLPGGLTVQNVVLADNGTSPDAAPNDGVYTGRFAGTTQPGAYGVSLAASGSLSGAPFSRETYLSVFVTASTSTLAGGLRESGRDLNSNGLFDQLVLEVPVRITAAGTYRLAATLADAAGNTLEASKSFELTQTSTSVELPFDGTALFARAVNGPYKITAVRMAEERGDVFLPLAESTTVFNTAAYQFTQFEGAGAALTGSNTVVGVDTDGNGKFNVLRADIGLNVRTAGAYEWTARLRDQLGREITLATGAGNLTVGLNLIRFSFDGAAIGRNGVDGPFTVTDLLLNGPDTLSVADVFATPRLAASAFEGFLAPAIAAQFSAQSASVNESLHSLQLTVTRTGIATVPVTVNYRTADATASERTDYTSTSGTLRFAAGETSKTIRVLITDDAFVEGNETFEVLLTDPTGGLALGTPAKSIVTIASDDAGPGTTNPIDGSTLFVRLHYHDFLGREPDEPGLAFWVNGIETCGQDTNCREVKRIDTSAAFFLSIEFQETGFLAYRTHKAAFGDLAGKPVPVRQRDFLMDSRQIGDGVVVGVAGWPERLEANKAVYFAEFANRPDFLTLNPLSLTAEQYVDGLFLRAGVVPTQAERQSAIGVYGAGGTAGRAAALRSVAESQTLKQAETNEAFVLMQYFGYLRRNPDDPQDTNFDGYNFWLNKLNQFGGDFRAAELVRAFISSIEYRQRFGQ